MANKHEPVTDELLGGVTVFQHPSYLAQKARRDELQGQVEALERGIADHEGRRAKLAADIDGAAARLLEGGTPAAVEIETERETLEGLQRDLAVAKRAGVLADGRLADLQRRLSAEAAEKLKPRYAEIVKQTAHALQQAVDWNEKLTRFFRRLDAEGILNHGLPALDIGVRRGQGVQGEPPAEPVFLRRARELGFIK